MNMIYHLKRILCSLEESKEFERLCREEYRKSLRHEKEDRERLRRKEDCERAEPSQLRHDKEENPFANRTDIL